MGKKIKKYKEQEWYKIYWSPLVVGFAGLIVIHAFIFVDAFNGSKIDPDLADKFGSFIGGYVGSLFGLISVIFLIITFKDQRLSSGIEKFETRFFELIKLHRDNVQDIGIGGKNGKKVFVLMIREYRQMFTLAKQVYTDDNFDRLEQIEYAYIAFFFGLGPNSDRVLRSAMPKKAKPLLNEFIELLNSESENAKNERDFSFSPFGGHQSRLGHYYRHLYQAINYCHNKKIDIDKYEYVKTIRAQLSNHEQALLAINSLSKLGSEWRSKGLMKDYQLIKNLPKDFFEKENEIDLKKVFPEIKFEYEG